MKRSLFHFPSLGSVCIPCRRRSAQAPVLRGPSTRPLNTASPKLADTDPTSANPSTGPSTGGSLTDLSQAFARLSGTSNQSFMSEGRTRTNSPSLTHAPIVRPHHLHIYATRHNCHITLSAGNRNPIISLSAGNIGFRKAQRGSYDAAYQLGVYVMSLIKNQAMLDQNYPGKGGYIRHLEVVLRDFGPGREAVTKILLGSEGRPLRSRIVRVMDGTRLKFGGSRSKKPRRLG